MVYAVLPFYLITVLNSPYIVVGILEGFFELVSNVIKVFSGYISDFRKKKYLIAYSFGLSIIGRFYLGFSKKWEDVMIYYLFESVCEGTKTPPIDILLSSKKKLLGKIFGINRVFENIGGLTGIFIAFFSSLYFLNEKSDYNIYFLFSVIPVSIAFILSFLIKEKVSFKRYMKNLSLEIIYPEYLVLFFLLSFASFGYSFYILKVYGSTESQGETISLYMLFYICLIITSYLSGKFFDFIGEKRFLFICIVLLFTAHFFMVYFPIIGFLVFAVADAFLDIGVWAILGQKVKFRKGFVFGMYHFTIGISGLFASLLAGYLWDNFGSEFPFLMGMFSSFFSFIFYLKILR